ncbi:cytochrome P450 [Pilobolus umbonatus]|nr:cytochrome P450 [Pilobolus umbonatus]
MFFADIPYINHISWDTLKNGRIDNKQTRTVLGITAATAILYSTYKLFSSPDPFKIKKGLKEIPIPDGAYPYVGHFLALNNGFAKVTMDWHKRFGPILRVRMGVQDWIFIDDPYLAHKLHVTNGAVSNSRSQQIVMNRLYSHFGKGLIDAPYGPSWKKTRNAALSILAPKKLDVYVGLIDEESNALVERLITCTEKEGGISPNHHLEFNTLNFISLALFGKRYESMDDPEYQVVANIPVVINKLIDISNDLSTFLPILTIVNLFKDSGAAMKKFVANERDPVLSRLIEAASKRDGPNLVKAIRGGDFDLDPLDEIVFFSDLLFAGTDTTACTLSWVFVIMCHHREVQDKIYDELTMFVQKNGRLPYYNEKHHAPYTFSALRECMRYRPTTNYNVPHVNSEDIEVDGYIIPKNTTIIMSMDSANRNPDVHSNPEEFIAERYIDNDKSMMASANGKIEERDHYTFGWGRRICPGIYLAELELYSAVTTLFSKCTIEAAETLPSLEKDLTSNLVCQPAPYKVKFVRRV